MEQEINYRSTVIKRASWIGIIGNGILATLKIGVGLFSHSLSLLGDGIDSASDIVTSIISLFASKIMNKPPDRDHPYGHGRIETISTKIISFIIFFAGIELASSSIKKIISGESNSITLIAIIVAGISIIGKLFLALYKFRAGKKIKSSLLIADAKNMRNDVVISVAVLIGLSIGKITGLYWFDSATALLVSFWIIYVGFSLFRENDIELMEGHDNLKDYQDLFDAVEKVEEAGNPHKVRIRKIGNALIIDLDIEVNGSLSVYQGHAIAVGVEKAIKDAMSNVYDVQVHIEPLGNFEEDEKYGVTREEL